MSIIKLNSNEYFTIFFSDNDKPLMTTTNTKVNDDFPQKTNILVSLLFYMFYSFD